MKRFGTRPSASAPAERLWLETKRERNSLGDGAPCALTDADAVANENENENAPNVAAAAAVEGAVCASPVRAAEDSPGVDSLSGLLGSVQKMTLGSDQKRG